MVGVATTPVTFVEVAVCLIENGWRPLPLWPDTKQPSDIGWNRLNQQQWSANEVGLILRQFGDHACGVAVPNDLFVVDIDVLDEQVSQSVQDIAIRYFGETPLLRVGMAPKLLMVYRSDRTTESKKPHPIELFSGSGQFAAFGIHAKTGRPYDWLQESPLTVRADSADIPVVTGRQQRAFLEEVRPLTQPRNPLKRGRAAGRGAIEANDPGEYLRLLMARGISFRRAVPRLLRLADVGQRHACIRAVISAGFNAGLSAEFIEDLIRRHAADETLAAVDADGYLTRTLRDFTPKFTRTL